MHKKVLNSLVLMLSASLIASCSTNSQNSGYYRSSSANNNLVASPTAVTYTPASVIIYNANETPTGSVEEITTVQVDLYNEYGIMRQQAQVNQMLKEQACSLGGNAVMLVDNGNDKKHCTAKILQTKPASTTAATNSASLTSTSVTTPK